MLALLRGNAWRWGSGRTIGLFVAAVVLLAAFVVSQLREDAPMFDFRLFRKPTFAGAQIVAFTISSAMFSLFLYLTLYLQNELHYSPLQAGLRFLPLSLLSFVTAPIAGRLSARIPVRILFGVGMALVGAALLLMHGLTQSSGWTHLLPGFIVGGIGVGLVNAPLAATAVGVVEPRRAGMASGINNTFRQVGIATGIAGLGAIFQSQGSFVAGLNEILLVGACVAFAVAMLGVALVRRATSSERSRQAWLIRIATFQAAIRRITAAPVTTIERLSGDRERDGVGLRHAGEGEQRRACAGLHRGPAGPIGTAAEAAEAQRKPRASGNEPRSASTFRSRKTAVPRRAHETEMSSRAASDSCGSACAR